MEKVHYEPAWNKGPYTEKTLFQGKAEMDSNNPCFVLYSWIGPSFWIGAECIITIWIITLAGISAIRESGVTHNRAGASTRIARTTTSLGLYGWSTSLSSGCISSWRACRSTECAVTGTTEAIKIFNAITRRSRTAFGPTVSSSPNSKFKRRIFKQIKD